MGSAPRAHRTPWPSGRASPPSERRASQARFSSASALPSHSARCPPSRPCRDHVGHEWTARGAVPSGAPQGANQRMDGSGAPHRPSGAPQGANQQRFNTSSTQRSIPTHTSLSQVAYRIWKYSTWGKTSFRERDS